MSFKVTFKPIDEKRIASATADAPGVHTKIVGKANQVAGRAASILSIYNVTSLAAATDRNNVQSEIHTLPVETFTRRQGAARDSDIDVALAVSDHPASQRLEYGSGRRIPMTRFMRKALQASGGAGWTRRVVKG